MTSNRACTPEFVNGSAASTNLSTIRLSSTNSDDKSTLTANSGKLVYSYQKNGTEQNRWEYDPAKLDQLNNDWNTFTLNRVITPVIANADLVSTDLSTGYFESRHIISSTNYYTATMLPDKDKFRYRYNIDGTESDKYMYWDNYAFMPGVFADSLSVAATSANPLLYVYVTNNGTPDAGINGISFIHLQVNQSGKYSTYLYEGYSHGKIRSKMSYLSTEGTDAFNIVRPNDIVKYLFSFNLHTAISNADISIFIINFVPKGSLSSKLKLNVSTTAPT